MDISIDDPRDEELRSDIRRLGAELGATLTRQHGKELLDLVEQVRTLTKSVRLAGDEDAEARLEEVLSSLALPDVIKLVRAFSAYFYLANVAEQTHRVGDLSVTDENRTLAATVDRILEAG
ncbi:MAG: phosphoenolpyruvate carboxylase, partial [Acidimicrobiia bacterium]|nr:phosphoenolpyruvate carboxylase [Acidimicrobiia bacterium]